MDSPIYKIEEEDSDKENSEKQEVSQDTGSAGNFQGSSNKKSKVSMKLTMAMIDRLLAQDTDSDNDIDIEDNEHAITPASKLVPRSDPVDIPTRKVTDIPSTPWIPDDRKNNFPSPWEDKVWKPQLMDLSPNHKDKMHTTQEESRTRKKAIPLFKQGSQTDGITQEQGTANVTATTPLFSLPNLHHRIMVVMALFSNASASMDTSNLPAELFNPWGEELIRIRKKQMNKEQLAPRECTLLVKHFGFIYLEPVTNLIRFLSSRTYMTTYSSTEVMTVNSTIKSLPNYCLQCDILHHFMAGQCRSIRKHGPRLLDNLKLDSSWRDTLKGVVIGTQELFYLPEDLKRTYLNLGSTTKLHYSVPANLDQLDHLSTTAGSLYSYLMQVVTLLGIHTTAPIFIEFYMNSGFEYLAVSYHLLGFLQVIKTVQETYHGPIMALVASVSPTPGGRQEDYWVAKSRQNTIQMLAYLLGYAVGVPVGMVPIQQLVRFDNNIVVRHDHWEEEAVYSSNGVKTREYFGRLSYYLTLTTKYLQQSDISRATCENVTT